MFLGCLEMEMSYKMPNLKRLIEQSIDVRSAKRRISMLWCTKVPKRRLEKYVWTVKYTGRPFWKSKITVL